MSMLGNFGRAEVLGVRGIDGNVRVSEEYDANPYRDHAVDPNPFWGAAEINNLRTRDYDIATAPAFTTTTWTSNDEVFTELKYFLSKRSSFTPGEIQLLNKATKYTIGSILRHIADS